MLVENELKNAYIGECPGGWQPDVSRTIFYYEFENNLNDSSGNGHNITASAGVGYNTVGGQGVIESTASTSGLTISPSWSSSIGSGDFTISFWLNPKQPASGHYVLLAGIYTNDSPYTGPTIFYDPLATNGQGDTILFRMRGGGSSYQHPSTTTASSLYNSWHHIVMTRNSGTVSCYIDGVLETSWSGDTEAFPTSNSSGFIFGRSDLWVQSWEVAGVMGDKFILENITWSPADIVAYYNNTKSLYGIS